PMLSRYYRLRSRSLRAMQASNAPKRLVPPEPILPYCHRPVAGSHRPPISTAHCAETLVHLAGAETAIVVLANNPNKTALLVIAAARNMMTRAASSTRFAAATIFNFIADIGSISIENILVWLELFARVNC